MDRLGPFKRCTDLDIVISDVVPGEPLAVQAADEDRQVGSRLIIEAAMHIAGGQDGGFAVLFTGFYEVTGKDASMGPGKINKKAEETMAELFTAATGQLGAA